MAKKKRVEEGKPVAPSVEREVTVINPTPVDEKGNPVPVIVPNPVHGVAASRSRPAL